MFYSAELYNSGRPADSSGSLSASTTTNTTTTAGTSSTTHVISPVLGMSLVFVLVIV